MEQAHKMHVMYRQLPERDPEMSNRKRVFTDAMGENLSEKVRNTFKAKLRNRKFMDALLQKDGSMSTEARIAHLGKRNADYPITTSDFTAEKRPVCREGGQEAYWIEVANNASLLGDSPRIYSPVLIAEANGVAIAKKGRFSLRFSDTLIQIANALDSVAPESKINPNYNLSRDDGKPSEIAEILLDGNGGEEYNTLKICLWGISQKGKGGLGRKKEISGTLFFILDGKAMERAASASDNFEEFLDAAFSQMEGFIRKIIPPEIAGGLGIYRCLKQVRL